VVKLKLLPEGDFRGVLERKGLVIPFTVLPFKGAGVVGGLRLLLLAFLVVKLVLLLLLLLLFLLSSSSLLLLLLRLGVEKDEVDDEDASAGDDDQRNFTMAACGVLVAGLQVRVALL